MALVPHKPPQGPRTVPVPREVLPVATINELLMRAATRAVENETSGTKEIKDLVLHPIRAAEHNARGNGTSPPARSTPLKGTRDLQIRAHVVNQILIRDFHSGGRGEHLKEWVKSLYTVADWLWASYREGAAPELSPIDSIEWRRPVPYTPEPIEFNAASPAERFAMYKRHMEGDPYQPFERYAVRSVHPHFEEGGSDEEMTSIRVKRQPGAEQKTTTAMENFMRMLQLENTHGVLDPESTDENPIHPSLLAGIWALSNLHDNFSQDPNDLDDPYFWLLHLLNHSFSRNHCYQKMTPGKRDCPHLSLPAAPALAVFHARNRPAIRSNIEQKYQRMFRALHLMVVQKVCLVLRTRFKRLHHIESTRESRVDPTAFNKAAGYHKSHLNEAEESWRKSENGGPQELFLLRRQQQRLLTCSDEYYQDGGGAGREGAGLPEVGKLAGEAERRKVAMAFLQREDLHAPVTITVAELCEESEVMRAKELLYHRVNAIDQSMALHSIYTDCVARHYAEERFRRGENQDRLLQRMRDAWSAGEGQTVDALSSQFYDCSQSAVHQSATSGRAEFLRGVATKEISLNIFERQSSFHLNSDVYGCAVPTEWCAAEGGPPALSNGAAGVNTLTVVEKMFPSDGSGLVSVQVYGANGAWSEERKVILRLLKELQDVLRLRSFPGGMARVVHLPMILVCYRKWGEGGAIDEVQLQEVYEYMETKARARSDMEECMVAFHDQMHHVVAAAFRFCLMRSLPVRMREAGKKLPMRATDDRVAMVARSHLYLMLAIARCRQMCTDHDQPIFSVGTHGLEMAPTREWHYRDWLGFAMLVDVALSAESGQVGREQSSVPLLPLPCVMLSRGLGLVDVPLQSREAERAIALMAERIETRFGAHPPTTFLDFAPFDGPMCATLLRLNWGSYKFLRTDAKTDDISRFARGVPWKDAHVLIGCEERRAATQFFEREYETYMRRGATFVLEGGALPPPSLTYDDEHALDETELFGPDSEEDECDGERNHSAKAPLHDGP